jgi:hypothetical protein
MRHFALQKTIASLVFFLFCLDSTIFAHPAVYSIAIPPEQGKIIQRRKIDTSDKLIIHIQDAHTSSEAQHNMAKIICSLIPAIQESTPKGQTPFIGIEGATDEYSLDELRTVPDRKARERVGLDFVKEGKFLGAELANIMTDSSFTLLGLEDSELFKEDFKAFRTVLTHKERLEAELNSRHAIITRIAERFGNKELNDFNILAREYESGTREFTEYLPTLFTFTESLGIDLVAYTSIYQFKNLLAIGETLDKTRLQNELDALNDTLMLSSLLDNDKEALSHITESFKNGKTSEEDYIAYIIALSEKSSITLSDYPMLVSARTYFSHTRLIDISNIIHEIRNLNFEIRMKLAQNENERLLVILTDRLAKIETVYTLKASRDEIMLFRMNKAEYTLDFIDRGIKRLAASLGSDAYTYTAPLAEIFSQLPAAQKPSILPNILTNETLESLTSQSAEESLQDITQIPTIDQLLAAIETFYSLADMRDGAILDNLLTQMDERGQSIGILVAGGYHSDGLKELLEKRGVSFITIRPTITSSINDVAYWDKMIGSLAPLDPYTTSHFTFSRITASFQNLNLPAFQQFIKDAGIQMQGQMALDENGRLLSKEELRAKIDAIYRSNTTDKSRNIAIALKDLLKDLYPESNDDTKTYIEASEQNYSGEDDVRRSIGKKVEGQKTLNETVSSIAARFISKFKKSQASREEAREAAPSAPLNKATLPEFKETNPLTKEAELPKKEAPKPSAPENPYSSFSFTSPYSGLFSDQVSMGTQQATSFNTGLTTPTPAPPKKIEKKGLLTTDGRVELYRPNGNEKPGNNNVNITIRDTAFPWPQGNSAEIIRSETMPVLEEIFEDYKYDKAKIGDIAQEVADQILGSDPDKPDWDSYRDVRESMGRLLSWSSHLEPTLSNKAVSEDDLQEFRKFLLRTLPNKFLADYETRGQRRSIDAYFQLKYIDNEQVVSFTPDNTVTTPLRFQEALLFTQRDIKNCGLDPILSLIERAKSKELLRHAFDSSIAPQFRELNKELAPNKAINLDALFEKLAHAVETLSINAVKDHATLMDGHIVTHPSRGGIGPCTGNSVWIGALTLRTLANYGHDGATFLSEILIQEAQHFIHTEKYPRHEFLKVFPDTSTNAAEVVEHSLEYTDKVITLVEGVHNALEKCTNGKINIDPDVAKRFRRRLEKRLLGERRWTSSEAKLVREIDDILLEEGYIYKKNDDVLEAVFCALVNEKNVYGSNRELFQVTKPEIAQLIEKIKSDEIYIEDLEEIKRVISIKAIQILLKEKGGNRDLGNLLFFLNDIDAERVRRVGPRGTVTIPSRIEPPKKITPNQHTEENLQPLVDFIQSTRTRSFLEDAFKQFMHERYARIGWDKKQINTFRDQMIDKLIYETSIDLVMTRVGVCCDLFSAHTRKHGEAYKRGPGIWIGEKTVRYLQKKANNSVTEDFVNHLKQNAPHFLSFVLPKIDESITGKEFFGAILLEEAQHMFAPPVRHAKLEKYPDGSTNFGKVIEHSLVLTSMLTGIIDFLNNNLVKRLELIRKTGRKNIFFSEIKEALPDGYYAAENMSFNNEAIRHAAALTLIEATNRETIPHYVMGQEINQIQDAEHIFVDSVEKNFLPILFVIDSHLPEYVNDEIRTALHQTKLNQVAVISSKEFLNEFAFYKDHFIFYFGKTQELLPANLVDVKKKAVYLIGNSQEEMALALLYFDFIYFSLVSHIVKSDGTLTTLHTPFKTLDFFPNFENISARSRAFLDSVYTVMNENAIRTAA